MKSLSVKIGVLVAVIGLTLLAYSRSFSFEVDWFKSGMTTKEVKEILNTINIDKIEEREGCIYAYDALNKITYRKYNLCFDKSGKLTVLQKDFSPSMKNFIAVFDKLTSLYGKPYDYLSRISIESYDLSERREISFMWKTHSDTIDLRYIVFSSNDQLSVTYKVGLWDYIK